MQVFDINASVRLTLSLTLSLGSIYLSDTDSHIVLSVTLFADIV